MRACLVLLTLIAGCGEGSDAPDLAAPDMTAIPDMTVNDLKPPPDLFTPPICAPTADRGDAGASMYFMCGGMACAANQYCCATGVGGGGTPTGTCNTCCQGANVLPVQCSHPGHCGEKPCCVTLEGMTPHDVSCKTSNSECPPMVSLTGGTSQTRGCRTNADCTIGAPGTMLNECCTVMGQKSCLNSQLAGFIGATCP